MTFEEFFKKKRIDLVALEKGEPALFFEFKTHYNQMGEKSFDHTKKYWFNKIRRQYNIPPEVKTEKPKIENQLAEQTITDSLTEAIATSAPKPGFTPRFKAPVAAKPAEETQAEENQEAATSAPKPAFTPRFKPGMAKPAEPSAEQPDEKKEETPAAPKPGFTPRFKAGLTKPADAPVEQPEEKKEETPSAPKPGFTPRFKAGLTKPAESTPPIEEKKGEDAPAPTLGFKPKFRPSTLPKTEED